MDALTDADMPIRAPSNYPFSGKFLSAVVWDEEHNSSEYSACVPYVLADPVFRNGFEWGRKKKRNQKNGHKVQKVKARSRRKATSASRSD